MQCKFRFSILLALVFFFSAIIPSFAMNLTGAVSNSSSQTVGRVFISVDWQDWGASGMGVSISEPGSFTIRGIPDGSFVLRAFMDSNNDGAFSVTEALGQSGVISVSDGQIVTGAPYFTLNSPETVYGTSPQPQPAQELRVKTGSGIAFLQWEYPLNDYQAILADSFIIEWSTNAFATVAGSVASGPLLTNEGSDEVFHVLSGLTNGVTYSFRVKSIIGELTAVSDVVTAVVQAPVGGYTVSGTISFEGSIPGGKPLTIAVWSESDENLYLVRYPSASNGMAFSVPGVQSGARGIFAFIDQNENGSPDFGDYFIKDDVFVTVNGSNLSSITIPISNIEVVIDLENEHRIDQNNQHSYSLWHEVEGGNKRPINVAVTGPQIGTIDMSLFEGLHKELALRPNLTDSYTFEVTFADGTSKNFTKTIGLVYDSPPTSLSPSGTIDISPTSLSWEPPTGFPTDGYTYVEMWGDNFRWGADQGPTATSAVYDGPTLQDGAYTFQVKLCDSDSHCISKATNFTLTQPPSGEVFNNSSKPVGPVFISVDWHNWGPSGMGITIPSPGSFTIRGIPDGWFDFTAFMDSNNDGAFSITEALGKSEVIQISGGVIVSGSPDITLFDPEVVYEVSPQPQPVLDLAVSTGDGIAFVDWDYPFNDYGAVAADSFVVEWSTDNFATVAGSAPGGPLFNLDGIEGGMRLLSGLSNGMHYSFRVKSIIGELTAVSEPVTATVGPPAGGYTVSGTISFNGFTSNGKPLMVAIWSDYDENFYIVRYSSASNGMAFSVPGVQNGVRGVFAFVDENANGALDFGDYFIAEDVFVNVNGADLTGVNVAVTAAEIDYYVENVHRIDANNQHSYFLWLDAEGMNKRVINAAVSGPQIGTIDMNLYVDNDIYREVSQRPNTGDTYTFNVTFADGSAKEFSKTIGMVYDSPPTALSPSGIIATSPTQISWRLPAGFPANGYINVHIWGNNNEWESKDNPSTLTAITYDGPTLAYGNYELQVELCDADWRCISKATNFTIAPPAATPGSLTVPADDADGNFTVSWGASSTPGASYTLEQATNVSFTAATVVYTGSGLSANLSGRTGGTSYYYRVRATAEPSYSTSAWQVAANPCKIVPAAPASITVPAEDTDGSYAVTWAASTSWGVSYTLEEATAEDFSLNLRTAYSGNDTSVTITGRSVDVTYYYRVRSDKFGYTSSEWKVAGNGCLIDATLPQAEAPTMITVPVTDVDGAFSVSWNASATAGVTYELQEATDAVFTTLVRTVYSGTALSAPIVGRTSGTVYYYRVQATKSDYQPSTWTTAANGCKIDLHPAGPVTVSATDADGSYNVLWRASSTAGITYELQEATDAAFTTGVRTAYSGTALFAPISDRVSGTTYYYRVQVSKTGFNSSAWSVAPNGCKIDLLPAGTLTVPATDADGSYNVSWQASPTAGITYELQEAADAAFTTAVRTAYSGTALSAPISDRTSGTAYYYRVQVLKTGFNASAWSVAANDCKVDLLPAGTLTVPATDADGSYTVSWQASATAGITYELQEATDAAFTTGVRTAYSGTALSTPISGRTSGTTYYYRLQVLKTGFNASAWTAAANGCQIDLLSAGTVTVPAIDTDGNYTVSWQASSTAGVTYTLQEATDAAFTAGLRSAYSGAALSADITGRTAGMTYYYRVQADKTGYSSSAWTTAGNGCKVGPLPAAGTPASITVPVADTDGSYVVKWGASATAGVTYILEEATDVGFSNPQTIYEGPALSKSLSDMAVGAKYFYRVKATHPDYTDSPWRENSVGCAVPGSVLPLPLSLGFPISPEDSTYRLMPAVDADGSYEIRWLAAGTTPENVTYVVEEATSSTYTTGLQTIYTESGLSTSVSGRTPGVTYYYRVKVQKSGYKDSAWKSGAVIKVNPPGLVTGTPASLTVPVADADGNYVVKWGASATRGATYVLQQATDAGFSDAQSVYEGPALTASLTERSSGTTYYYRVKAIHPEYTDSAWKVGTGACAVPGTVLAMPVSVGFTISELDSTYRVMPAVDADGSYRIRWVAAATTPTNVTYVVEEATNSTYTTGLQTIYSGSGLTTSVSGRTPGVTYYYRVKVQKPGYKDSVSKTGAIMKVIGLTQTAAAPASITVPVADADGNYIVKWKASATKGVTYVLEEATDAAFTNPLMVYEGLSVSKALSGRPTETTYFYRVKATHPEYMDSDWREKTIGCAVPGTALGVPASMTVPPSSTGGNYEVSWGASTTPGVTYVVQEATNGTFTLGLREFSAGSGLGAFIESRTPGATYYYRVKAVKPGYKASGWKKAANGCRVTGP